MTCFPSALVRAASFPARIDTAEPTGSARPLLASLLATHETNETAKRLYDKLAERSGFIVYRRML